LVGGDIKVSIPYRVATNKFARFVVIKTEKEVSIPYRVATNPFYLHKIWVLNFISGPYATIL